MKLPPKLPRSPSNTLKILKANWPASPRGPLDTAVRANGAWTLHHDKVAVERDVTVQHVRTDQWSSSNLEEGTDTKW